MMNIGLTMRYDPTPHGEWRNTLDAHWPELIKSLGFTPILLPNKGMDGAEIITAYNLDAIILTGGNDVLESGSTYSIERNQFEFSLMHAAQKKKIPVVGVCRGMQMMNLFFDGTVKPIDHVPRVDHAVQWQEKSCNVNSYHNFGIDDLGKGLKATAIAYDQSIEAVQHDALPWQAVMWHPERPIENESYHHDWLKAALKGIKA